MKDIIRLLREEYRTISAKGSSQRKHFRPHSDVLITATASFFINYGADVLSCQGPGDVPLFHPIYAVSYTHLTLPTIYSV